MVQMKMRGNEGDREIRERLRDRSDVAHTGARIKDQSPLRAHDQIAEILLPIAGLPVRESPFAQLLDRVIVVDPTSVRALILCLDNFRHDQQAAGDPQEDHPTLGKAPGHDQRQGDMIKTREVRRGVMGLLFQSNGRQIVFRPGPAWRRVENEGRCANSDTEFNVVIVLSRR